jgi:hypothetical protein
MKKIISGTFALVAVYLVVANATGAGKIISSAASGYRTGVKTLQGR